MTKDEAAKQAVSKQECIRKKVSSNISLISPLRPLCPPAKLVDQQWRALLYQHKLIGQDPMRYGGYGYGNLSVRLAPYDAPPALRAFIISGSQTGELSRT